MTAHGNKDIKFHADIAAVYDYLTVEPRELSIKLLFKKIDKKIRPAKLMIDLGCGTGHILCRHKNKFSKCIGVDHSREMLEQAGGKPELRNGNIVLIHSDIGSFMNSYTGPQPDFISMVGLLHHLEKHELTLVLNRVHDLLMAGGQLLIAEPILSPKVSRLINWINHKSILHERLSKAMPPQTEDPDEEPLIENDLINSVSKAGFKIKLVSKAYDILHLNYPPKLWERIFLKITWIVGGGGKNGDVLALLAEKSPESISI